MPHRYEKPKMAEIGETWWVKKRDGTEIKLVLGFRKGCREWFYPRTVEVYEKQDLVGLVRRAPAV